MNLVTRISQVFPVASEADPGPVETPVQGDVGPDPEAVDATVDEVLHILRSPRRRWVIEHLEEVGEATTGTAADARAAEKYGGTYSSQERRREYISMYQQHLPTLDDAGVIDYEDHLITPGENFGAYVEALGSIYDVCGDAGVGR